MRFESRSSKMMGAMMMKRQNGECAGAGRK
jgi:hypothetical protein